MAGLRGRRSLTNLRQRRYHSSLRWGSLGPDFGLGFFYGLLPLCSRFLRGGFRGTCLPLSTCSR